MTLEQNGHDVALELSELQQDVKDCETELSLDELNIMQYQRYAQESTVRLAEAVIALDKFKKQHGV